MALRGVDGAEYVISKLSDGAFPELRWTRRVHPADSAEPVMLRAVVADLQAYEPARSLTRAVVAQHHHDPGVSVAQLRAELVRVDASPLLLNRGLREAVERRMERGISPGAIALRCGRTRRDGTGEASWLRRRIGAMTDSSQNTPTPWIHCDVLALIAREGLGIDPREVELG